jgi:hypothetical protein
MEEIQIQHSMQKIMDKNIEIDLPKWLLDSIRVRGTKIEKSKFESKIGMLLDYVENSPDKQFQAGCKWEDEIHFIINKDQLIKVFNYKNKSGLNKNLSKFHPEKIQKKKEPKGWHKCWKDNFVKGQFSNTLELSKQIKSEDNLVLQFGQADYIDEDFLRKDLAPFKKIFGEEIKIDDFEKFAEMLRIPNRQSLENAIDVLKF